MTSTITVTIDDREVSRMLAQLKARLGKTKPLMTVIGETIRTSVERNFAAGGRPGWEPSTRVRQYGGQTLSDTGRLRRSFTVASGNGWSAVGTNVSYAAIHQLGGKTKPHIIKPKKKKALKTPYGIFKQVKHPGSEIPARPFLMVQEEDWEEIKATIADFLKGGIG